MPIRRAVMVEWIILWILVGGVVVATGSWLTHLVALDGYGVRPAPRGDDDWTAHGLPSHPYGV
jgi:hypothetical protein